MNTPPSSLANASLLSAALRRADEAVDGATFATAPRVTRWWCIGDPQASFAHFATALARHGLLGADGLLADAAGLVSLGDHFDYGSTAAVDVDGTAARGREGQRILAWLAAQPRSRVRILLGNHDAARVMELAHFDDDVFARARAESPAAKADDRSFRERYRVPSAGCVLRDFCTWTTAQRAQVQRLLVDGRYDLALAAVDDARPVLLTHAGITTRELALLGLANDALATTVAACLNERLAHAVAAVATMWTKAGTTAGTTPLDLAPLHLAGTTGEEAGGLLAHRPAPAGDDPWAWNPARPRRFRVEALPRHFDQILGHTGGSTLAREWKSVAHAVVPHGRVNTLLWQGDDVAFAAGQVTAVAGRPRAVFVDAGLYASAGAIELVSVAEIVATESAAGVVHAQKR
jgi:hypothetical protein